MGAPVAARMVPVGIPTTLTFYRRQHAEYHWHTYLPAAPTRGESIHPGAALGEDFERCWEVLHVRWVHESGTWELEVGLT